MAVIMTSFENSEKFQGIKLSVAQFQPAGAKYRPLKFLFPVDEKGARIKADINNPGEYKNRVSEAYKKRWEEIHEWLLSLKKEVDLVLMCWCPHSSGAEEQLREKSEFICHTGLIAQMIQKHRPDIDVIMDEDRELALSKEFRVVPSKCLRCGLYEAEEPDCSMKKYCAGPYAVEESGRIRSLDPQYASITERGMTMDDIVEIGGVTIHKTKEAVVSA